MFKNIFGISFTVYTQLETLNCHFNTNLLTISRHDPVQGWTATTTLEINVTQTLGNRGLTENLIICLMIQNYGKIKPSIKDHNIIIVILLFFVRQEVKWWNEGVAQQWGAMTKRAT